MAYPPKGHPDRPLRLAASSMLTLGILLLLLSACGGFGMIGLATSGAANWVAVVSMVVGMLFYVAPGVGFIVCWVYLKRYQRWAAIVGIVLTSLLLLGALFMFIGMLAMALSSPDDGPPWLMSLIPLLFVIAFTQLIVHLSKSFKAIRIHEAEGPQGHGFEPLMAERVHA